jgi:hypothetical protein
MCGFGSTTNLAKHIPVFHAKNTAQKYVQALQKL